MFKKILATFLAVVLCISVTMPALAVQTDTTAHESSFMLGDILYTETRTSDGQYCLTATKNGLLVDRVTVQIGQNEFYYETPNDSLSGRSSANEVNVQVLHLSDFITYVSPNVTTRAPSYTPKTGSLGTVTYNLLDASGYVERKLKFTSALYDQTTGNFDVRGAAGDPMSAIFAAIVAGFSFKITTALGVAIAAGAGAVGGNVLDKAFTSTISGTCYLYNVTAKSADTSDPRSSTHGGEVYAGGMKVNDVWTDKVIYESYYPEFIQQKDNAVAVWFFTDFWDGVFSVTSWS